MFRYHSRVDQVHVSQPTTRFLGFALLMLVLQCVVAQELQAEGNRLLVRPKGQSDLSSLHQQQGATVLRVYPGIYGLQIVEIDENRSIESAFAAYGWNADVEYVERDRKHQARPGLGFGLSVAPSDGHFAAGEQWALNNTGSNGGTPYADIDALRAWSIRTDASSVLVAVVDSGARTSHEDLNGNLWRNPGGNMGGYEGTWERNVGTYGLNAINRSGEPADDWGHGSHITGVIGAVGNNGMGISGVAWKAQTLQCKFIDSEGSGWTSHVIECLDFVRTQGAKIVNASWGSDKGPRSKALHDAIESLMHAGVLFVTAAGNDGVDIDENIVYPARFDLENIIVVAATDRWDNLASFSNFGSESVHLGAPGHDIVSSSSGSDSDYQTLSGTSMAVAHVTAAAALLWAHFPNEDYRQIKSRLLSSVEPRDSLTGRTITGGRLNVYNALTWPPGNGSWSGVPSSLSGATAASAELWDSPWFGRLLLPPRAEGWINSEMHGWIFVFPNQAPGQMWYWDPGIFASGTKDGWVYTGSAVYPFVYINSSGWAYYHSDSSNASARAFYEYNASSWIQYGLWAGPLQSQ